MSTTGEFSSSGDVVVVDKDGNTVGTDNTVRVEGVTPIIVDLGTRSRRDIRHLKEGRGSLMTEVGNAISRVRSSLAGSSSGGGSSDSGILPVIILYRKSSRTRRIRASTFLPSPFNIFR